MKIGQLCQIVKHKEQYIRYGYPRSMLYLTKLPYFHKVYSKKSLQIEENNRDFLKSGQICQICKIDYHVYSVKMYDMDVQSNEISKKPVGTSSNRGNFVKFAKF